MHTIHVDEAQSRLSDLIGEASRGEDVVITREDGAAVRLVPIRHAVQPKFGSARGLIAIADDFDAPLPDFAPYER